MKTLEEFLSAYGTTVNDATYAIREILRQCNSVHKKQPWYQDALVNRAVLIESAMNIAPASISNTCLEIDSGMLRNNRIFTPNKDAGIYFSLRNHKIRLLTTSNGVTINGVYIPRKEVKYKSDTPAVALNLKSSAVLKTETVADTVTSISASVPEHVKTTEATVTLSVEVPASDVGRFLLENKQYGVKILKY